MKSWADAKDPNAEYDLQFDWSKRLEEGETIASSVFLKDDDTLVIDRESIDGAFTTFWVAGGTAGEPVEITNRIVTSEGRKWDKTGILRMREQ